MVDIDTGAVTQSKKGGDRALTIIFQEMKMSFFNGLIRTSLGTGPASKRGYIGLRAGKPVLAIHAAGGGELFGPDALKLMWDDTADAGCTIEVVDADVEEIMEKYPDSRLQQDDAPGKRARPIIPEPKKQQGRRRVGLVWGQNGSADDAEIEPLRRKLELWLSEGYDVKGLKRYLEGDVAEAKKVFSETSAKIARLKELKEELDLLGIKGFEKELKDLKSGLYDPERLDYLEKRMAELGQIKESVEKEELVEVTGELKELKEHKERQDRVKGVYDLILMHGKTKPEEGEDDQDSLEGEGVNTFLTFANFVVGPSNRFAQAAALSVSKEPSKSYNPLFLWSGPGLGKTHLLMSIANSILEKYPDWNVVYISTEKFTNEMIDSLQKNELMKFRDKYRNIDVLLLDDVQFLAGRDQTQEEFFHTFNALYTAGRQIILASDRPPKEIPTLKSRLISRFEGGLICDIQSPDFEMRVAILKKKSEEKALNVPHEVLTYIASKQKSNIRELGGALNRVVAFSSLMKQEITLDLAKEVLRDIEEQEAAAEAVPGTSDPADAEAPPESPAPSAPASAPPVDVEPGESYLVEEDRPDRSIAMLKELMGGGKKALYITRSNPKRLKQKYGLGGVQVLWLTDKDSSIVDTVAPVLERIIFLIEDFIREDGVCLIDGLEYLISNNSFDSVLRFIRKLVDDFSETKSVFLVSVGAGTLAKQELSVLEREMVTI